MSTKTTSKTNTKTAAAPVATQRGGELRNGVRRPTQGGIVNMMWDAFDAMPALMGRKELTALAEATGWNRNLLGSHFRQWKQWNGVGVESSTVH